MRDTLSKVIVNSIHNRKLWLSNYVMRETDIGRPVCYIPLQPSAPWELGIITSYNDLFIFVDFNRSGRGVATPAQYLVFEDDMYTLEDHINIIKGEIHEEQDALEDAEVLKATIKF